MLKMSKIKLTPSDQNLVNMTVYCTTLYIFCINYLDHHLKKAFCKNNNFLVVFNIVAATNFVVEKTDFLSD